MTNTFVQLTWQRRVDGMIVLTLVDAVKDHPLAHMVLTETGFRETATRMLDFVGRIGPSGNSSPPDHQEKADNVLAPLEKRK